MTTVDKKTAMDSKAWPFQEAKAVLERIEGKTPAKGYVLFETGYGASGLPHIGTFQEVLRTNMVMNAFRHMSDIPAKLVSFADDMDGLRKVPQNIPNKKILEDNLHKPLTSIPDPFEEYESFAHYNNARMREFLDSFGFEYTFYSSTEFYKSGRFDKALLRMLELYEEVKSCVLPILGEERKQTYSPFLPISPKTGKVLQVPILETNADAGTIIFEDEDGTKTELPVTGGNVKCQWRPDWALRWYALDVDYEMAGEDLISAGDIAGKITEVMGGKKPAGFRYKLFLDENGQKISKSKGNGLSMDEWLAYAPHESLAYYMFLRPTSGKKLYFDIIPKAVDDYISLGEKLDQQNPEELAQNPVWHIHNGQVSNLQRSPLSFSLMLNIAAVSNAENKEVLWGFIKQYRKDISPGSHHFVDRLAEYAVKYYKDFVAPAKSYRLPDGREKAALLDLARRLEILPDDAGFEDFQTEVFSAGKENGYQKNELREWFQAIYEVLLGQTQGPRFGSFIEVYGRKKTITLIHEAVAGKYARAA